MAGNNDKCSGYKTFFHVCELVASMTISLSMPFIYMAFTNVFRFWTKNAAEFFMIQWHDWMCGLPVILVMCSAAAISFALLMHGMNILFEKLP